MKKVLAWLRMTPAAFFYSLFMVTLGTCIYAIGLNSVVLPNHFANGGMTGFGLLVYYFTGIPIGWTTLVVNSLLLMIGWRLLEKRTLVFTIYSVIVLTFALDYLKLPAFHSDNMLVVAVVGGVMFGIGLGIIIRGNGSMAGTDIIAMIMKKYFGINFSASILACDVIIVGASALIIDIEKVVITLIMMTIVSYTLNFMTEGLNRRKSVMIISDHREEIATRLDKKIGRGMTVLKAYGQYSKKERDILYIVVNSNQIINVQRMISEIDDHAFVIVSDVQQVTGQGFSFYTEPNRNRKFYE